MDEPPQPVIASIRIAGRGRQRLITLDDGREFFFSEEAYARVHPKEGDGADLLEDLDNAEQRVVAHEAALRLLSHRPRSESEMRMRLAMRGVAPGTIADEVVRLRDAGLLNDEQFARAWVENRKQTAPRGRRMLRYELLGRGIEPEAVDAVTNDVDDATTALQLARRRARSVPKGDYEAFMGKVLGFLRRRGFDYAVASRATGEVWAEVSAEVSEDAEPSDE
jgi:regulatory protein